MSQKSSLGKNIEEIFNKTIKELKLVRKKDKVILGLSGGPDSVAMFYNFLKLRREYKLRIVCAHFNHCLRKESAEEAAFVKKICRNAGIELLSEKKDVGSLFKGDSLEQAARNLRFDFFLKCSRRKKIKKVALAHHKDDLAETVLMRIIRGTGLRGLRGFLPKANFRSLTVIRPFIYLRKQQILSWLDKEQLQFCTDRSNLDDKFLRNKIRNKLLPELEAVNPGVIARLADLAAIAGFDYDFIYEFSRKSFLGLKKQKSGRGIRLELEGLKKLHPAIFNNVLRIAIEEVKGDTRRIEQAHLNQIRQMVISGSDTAGIHLPRISVKKERNIVLIQSLIL